MCAIALGIFIFLWITKAGDRASLYKNPELVKNDYDTGMSKQQHGSKSGKDVSEPSYSTHAGFNKLFRINFQDLDLQEKDAKEKNAPEIVKENEFKFDNFGKLNPIESPIDSFVPDWLLPQVMKDNGKSVIFIKIVGSPSDKLPNPSLNIENEKVDPKHFSAAHQQSYRLDSLISDVINAFFKTINQSKVEKDAKSVLPVEDDLYETTLAPSNYIEPTSRPPAPASSNKPPTGIVKSDKKLSSEHKPSIILELPPPDHSTLVETQNTATYPPYEYGNTMFNPEHESMQVFPMNLFSGNFGFDKLLSSFSSENDPFQFEPFEYTEFRKRR